MPKTAKKDIDLLSNGAKREIRRSWLAGKKRVEIDGCVFKMKKQRVEGVFKEKKIKTDYIVVTPLEGKLPVANIAVDPNKALKSRI